MAASGERGKSTKDSGYLGLFSHVFYFVVALDSLRDTISVTLSVQKGVQVTYCGTQEALCDSALVEISSVLSYQASTATTYSSVIINTCSS